ncbi:molybdopterin-dependent oxidoreductase [Rhizobium sp.]
MLKYPSRRTVVTHWGTYTHEDGDRDLQPIAGDPDPSPIAASMTDPFTDRARIRRPAIRTSFLKGSRDGRGRGTESFTEVPWDEALDIAAAELDRVRGAYGNGAIFGGSYGWASAGRFHHAQSQVHRFLNCIGGYTRSVNTYSTGAAEVLVPHILGDTRGLNIAHTTWPVIEQNTKLIAMFGGAPQRNAQVNSGGVSRHVLRDSLLAARANGCEIVSISPIRDDVLPELSAEWLPIVPTTDVALMLAIAHTLLEEGLHDAAFLERYTEGFDRFASYVRGQADGMAKSADWAAPMTRIDAETIRGLARRMARTRTMIMTAWALQRSEHGEQPYWMTITLAAMLGQIGLPGGGFGFGYGSINGIGVPVHGFSWPSLPQGRNAISDYIPVARISDMLLGPGEPYDYNGETRRYPDIKLVYWAGGNPFHHHQDLHRLNAAWQRPEAVIVHDSWWTATARRADIVIPVVTQMERDDIACSSRDRLISPSHRIKTVAGGNTDYDVFARLASRLGVEEAFTEGRTTEEWLRHLYRQTTEGAGAAGFPLPDFDDFWQGGAIVLPEPNNQPSLLEDFRADPDLHRLKTPSGRIEIHSATIESFGYDDCPGHPQWLEPQEWLGAAQSAEFPLHLISNQPSGKLHSQYDNGSTSRRLKTAGREKVRMHPEDALARDLGDGDVAKISSRRGACIAVVAITPDIVPGVIQLPTGAWFDPQPAGDAQPLEVHGNPNALTRDAGTSKLAQGTSAHSCLVQVEKYLGTVPDLTVFDQPVFETGRAAINDG